MPVDMFLKIDGVNGEAKDKGGEQRKDHSKEIDVLSWTWGMSNNGSAHVLGGSGSGKVNVQNVRVTKYVDSASPKLMKACCSGTHFDEALLTVRKAGGTPVEYIKIKMEQVFISSISTGGSGGEDRLTETVSLNFAKVNLDYTPQTAKGDKGTPIPFGWDIAANAEA
jgi:type VI secretion system secreted protein Hcp